MRAAQAPLKELTVTFTVDTDADDAALSRLATLTERYCVVGRSLAEPCAITIRRLL